MCLALSVEKQVWAEQIEVYTGKDDLDPPLEFAISDTVTVKFGSWSEMSEICGDSRLWGGMHFAVSDVWFLFFHGLCVVGGILIDNIDFMRSH